MSSTERSAELAWSLLWAQSPRGAIDLAGTDPIAEALRSFWLPQAEELAREAQRVADIGSGPAVLVQLLCTLAPANLQRALNDIEWWAIDRATLVPDGDPPGTPRIVWKGQTDFATAEPPAGGMQALISNFGLEYVTRGQASRACARWLAPGGTLTAVMHAQGSLIDQVSRRSAEDIDAALDELALFDAAAQLCRAASARRDAPMPSPEHGASQRREYNRVVDELKRRMDARGELSPVWMDMLRAVHGVVGSYISSPVTMDLDQALNALARLQDNYRHEAARLADMRQSALDDQALQELLKALRDDGFASADSKPLRCSRGLVAWTIRAHRRAG